MSKTAAFAYTPPNDNGVYFPDQCEVITFEERKSATRIMLAHITKEGKNSVMVHQKLRRL